MQPHWASKETSLKAGRDSLKPTLSKLIIFGHKYALISLKGTGWECWLVQNYKEKGSIIHQFTCFCMENHLRKFQLKRTLISWDMNENINNENKKNSGFGEVLYTVKKKNTLSHHIIDNFLQWVFLSKLLQYLGFCDTIWQFFYHFTSELSTFAFYPPTL